MKCVNGLMRRGSWKPLLLIILSIKHLVIFLGKKISFLISAFKEEGTVSCNTANPRKVGK